jgi:hypothetical protein
VLVSFAGETEYEQQQGMSRYPSPVCRDEEIVTGPCMEKSRNQERQARRGEEVSEKYLVDIKKILKRYGRNCGVCSSLSVPLVGVRAVDAERSFGADDDRRLAVLREVFFEVGEFMR